MLTNPANCVGHAYYYMVLSIYKYYTVYCNEMMSDDKLSKTTHRQTKNDVGRNNDTFQNAAQNI